MAGPDARTNEAPAGRVRGIVASRARAGVTAVLDRRNLFVALMSGLTVAAWAIIWMWSRSPYGRYLDHGNWTEIGIAGAICRVVPAGEVVLPALLYAAGWVLMIAAMMLPTTAPLLGVFRRITAGRSDAARLLALVIAGYVGAWLGFGLLAHGLDWLVHGAVERVPWLVVNGWAIGAAVLGGAGLFQFSALKYRCLDKCRTPFGFVASHWHGTSPSREALQLGVAHGAFCVGCCWALMLLMFVVGTGNTGWMLGLAAVMAAEKNLPGGQRLSAPLGIALIAGSVTILVVNLG